MSSFLTGLFQQRGMTRGGVCVGQGSLKVIIPWKTSELNWESCESKFRNFTCESILNHNCSWVLNGVINMSFALTIFSSFTNLTPFLAHILKVYWYLSSLTVFQLAFFNGKDHATKTRTDYAHESKIWFRPWK